MFFWRGGGSVTEIRCIQRIIFVASVALFHFMTNGYASPLTPRTPHRTPESTRRSVAHPAPHALDWSAPRPTSISSLTTPLRWLERRLRASGDCSHGQVRFVPWSGISPTLTLEGGSLFEVDPQRIATLLGIGFGAYERLGYDFGHAHLGLKLGSARAPQLLLRGGFSMLVPKPDGFGNARSSRSATADRPRTQLGASARLMIRIPI
jgi:hypothetical protein